MIAFLPPIPPCPRCGKPDTLPGEHGTWRNPCLTETEQAEKDIDRAKDILRHDYFTTVRAMAEDLKRRLDAGDFGTGEQASEGLDEAIHEDCDGSSIVIYTHEAQACLMWSENDSAGPDETGADSFDWSNGVPWSALAFHALRADVVRHLEALDVDLNDPRPEPEED